MEAYVYRKFETEKLKVIKQLDESYGENIFLCECESGLQFCVEFKDLDFLTAFQENIKNYTEEEAWEELEKFTRLTENVKSDLDLELERLGMLKL